MGIVHGLAGSAAITLLVLGTIRDPMWSVIYLGMFGLGTVFGMALATVIISGPLAVSRLPSAKLERVLVPASGLLSLGFGILMVYQIGFADGLLLGTPR